MAGNCIGCGNTELEARQLCARCYNYNRSQARRQGLDLGVYLNTTTDLRSPGRHHQRPHKHNKSGFRGCYLDRGKWRAVIRVGGKSVHLGRFERLELAMAAYQRAQERVRQGRGPIERGGPEAPSVQPG